MRNWIFFTLLFLVLIAGCKKPPAGDRPRIVRAEFLNTKYTVEEQWKVNATVVSRIPSTVSYTWSINGVVVEDVTESTLPTSFFKKRDKITCTIIAKDSLGKESEPYELGPLDVENTPPVIAWADIYPSDSIYKGVDLAVEVETEDLDEDDDVTVQYTWFIGNSLAGYDSILPGDMLRAGENVRVELVPHDGDTTGDMFEITRPIMVQNLPPRFIGIPSPVVKDSIVTIVVNAEDPDGDPLTYSILQGPSGMSIDTTGTIVWRFSPPETTTTYNIIVKVTDQRGAGDKIIIPFTVTKTTGPE
jgi:hypothetical protein